MNEEILEKKLAEVEKEQPLIENNQEISKILKLIESVGTKLFHDELGEPYASIPQGNHLKTMRIGGKQFNRWLSKLVWDNMKKAIRTDTKLNVIAILEAKACAEGGTIPLYIRVAWHNDNLWYDLSDGRAVNSDKKGWQIIEQPPIMFRNFSHQKQQTVPSRVGDIKELLKFINVSDPEKQLLLLVWVVSCFIPDFPHPILCIHGPQGSSKSTLCKILKDIIDPSQLDAISFPNKEAELVQILDHNWFLCFDNVSYLSESSSDTLCRAITGAGFTKRALFTNDDDFVFKFKRCIVINGINLVVGKPDLMERSLLVELDRISDDGINRREEQELYAELAKDKPSIMGGIFDTVSKALLIKPTIRLSKKPRMADFANWGCAIAEALGYEQQAFVAAYTNNRKSQNEEVIESNLLATVLARLMEDLIIWDGTASDLLNQLNEKAGALRIDTSHEKVWPKSAAKLSKSLNIIKNNLEDTGIKIWRNKENKERIIHIELTKSADAGDDGDGAPPSVEGIPF
jgi:energy-coupling factor transporter ATP-binding protein EcfA2